MSSYTKYVSSYFSIKICLLSTNEENIFTKLFINLYPAKHGISNAIVISSIWSVKSSDKFTLGEFLEVYHTFFN